MKQFRKTLLAACALSALVSSAAIADNMVGNGWYAGVSGDATWLEGSDTGGGGQVVLGTRFWPSDMGDFRVEAEAGYHDVSGSHYFTYMGNLYYDFGGLGSNKSIRPYIGAGLGDATLHLGERNAAGEYTIRDDVFAYQFMAGLNFEASPGTEWYLGYRYLGSDNGDSHDNAGISRSDDIRANNIELGARFHF